MKKIKQVFWIVPLVIMFMANVGWGQLLLTDDFTGLIAGNNLAGQSSWAKGGSGPDPIIGNTTPLTYTGYNGGGTEYVVMPAPSATTSKVYKALTSTPTPGTNTFYYSLLLRLTSTSATSSNYFITLGDPTTGTVYFARLFAQTNGAGYNIGISKQSNTATYGTTLLNLNTTYLIVVRYDFVTGATNDAVYLWVNPSLSSEPLTSSAEATISTGTDPAPATVGNFLWHNRGVANPVGAFDGIRVAYGATSAIAWTNLNIASGGPTPSISVNPLSLPAFITSVGNPSASQTYTVSATNLTANLVINAPANFEIRENGIGTFGSSLIFIPSGGTVPTKTIEVRVNSVTAKTYIDSIANTSSGATTRNVFVTGAVNTLYYNAADQNLNDVNNWSTNPDGSPGTQPTDFLLDNQTFIIQNGTNPPMNANWTVSGAYSKVILGDGVNPTSFNINSTNSLTGTIDVSANASLTLQNSTLPTLGTIGSSSTVSYEYSGSSNVQLNTYGNLILKNGTKVFQPNTTTVLGSLTFSDVTLDASSGPTIFSTIALSGDLTYTGTVTNPIDGNSITLICNKGATQTITGNGNTARFFRLTTTGAGTNVVLSTTGGSTNLLLANLISGGFNLASGTTVTVNSNTVEFLTSGKGYFFAGSTGTLTCDGTSSLILNTLYNTPGTIYFSNGSNLVNNLTINETGTGNFTLGSSLTINGTLTMSNGNLSTGTNSLILGTSTASTGTLNWTSGMIIGGFTRWFNNGTTVSRLFPIGTSVYSKQVEIQTNIITTGGTIKAEYIAGDPGVSNLTSLTDAGSYTIDAYSKTGKWVVTPGNGLDLTGGNYDIKITAENIVGVSTPAELRIVKRPSTGNPWALDGTHSAGDGTNAIPRAARTGLTAFSEFSIAGNFAVNPLDGLLPVELSSFTSNVIARDVKLNWTTATELNNAGFEILRSAQNDKDNWIKIGYVNGNGTKTTPTNYTFEDRKLTTGKYNYRLKQVDYNGNFEYFNLAGLIEIGVPKKYDVSQNYPNPFNPTTKIDIDLPYDSKVSMKLYDISGREVMTLLNETKTAGYYTVQMNGVNLASGMYFYRIIAEGNSQKFVSSKKLVLIK